MTAWVTSVIVPRIVPFKVCATTCEQANAETKNRRYTPALIFPLPQANPAVEAPRRPPLSSRNVEFGCRPRYVSLIQQVAAYDPGRKYSRFLLSPVPYGEYCIYGWPKSRSGRTGVSHRIRTQRCNQLRPRMCVLFESGGLSYPDPGGPGDGSPAGSGWRVLDLVRLGGAAGSDGLKAETKLEGKVGPVIGCFNGRNISNR